MTRLADQGFLQLGQTRLEYRMIGPRPDAAPTLVLLHEGLGSADIWGSFAQELAAATGTVRNDGVRDRIRRGDRCCAVEIAHQLRVFPSSRKHRVVVKVLIARTD